MYFSNAAKDAGIASKGFHCTIDIPILPDMVARYAGTGRDLYGGAGDAEVHVKELRGTGNGDIVDQYVRFCKIADEERKRHGRSGKAIEETIRRCIEENVLAPLLMTRQKEVAEIMVTLFDQEKVMEIHDYHIAEAAKMDGMLSGIKYLMETSGLPVDKAMLALGIPDAEQSAYAKMLEQ